MSRKHGNSTNIVAAVLLALSVAPLCGADSVMSNLTNDVVREAFVERVKQAVVAQEKGSTWPSDLPTVTELLDHPLPRIRWDVAGICFSQAEKSSTSEANRKQYVERLVERLFDSDTFVSEEAERWLVELKCSPTDFTTNAVARMRKAFRGRMNRNRILLMASIDLEYCAERTRHLLDGRMWTSIDDPPIRLCYGAPAWAANLVWAKKGDKDSIRRVLDGVEKDPDVSDRLILGFKDLTYVRQPEVVEYIRPYVFSDKVLGEKGTDIGILSYALQGIAALREMLKGFPSYERSTPDAIEIEGCRKWLLEQKAWEFK